MSDGFKFLLSFIKVPNFCVFMMWETRNLLTTPSTLPHFSILAAIVIELGYLCVRCFSDMVDIVFPILEGRMLVREWLWKKSLLLQLSGEVFIVICSEGWDVVKVNISWFFALKFCLLSQGNK